MMEKSHGEAGLGEGRELRLTHVKREVCGRLCFSSPDAPHLLRFIPLCSPPPSCIWGLLEPSECSTSDTGPVPRLGLGKAWPLLLLRPWKPAAIEESGSPPDHHAVEETRHSPQRGLHGPGQKLTVRGVPPASDRLQMLTTSMRP